MYAGRIVEIGSTRDVFARHRMPYTRALLEGSPKVSNPSHTRLAGHPGATAEPARTCLRGCAFAPRCAYATDRCHEERPELEPADEARSRLRLLAPAAGDPRSDAA